MWMVEVMVCGFFMVWFSTMGVVFFVWLPTMRGSLEESLLWCFYFIVCRVGRCGVVFVLWDVFGCV